MPNTIRLKRSSLAGKAPAAADLALGEIAVNTTDGKLYLKKSDGGEFIVHNYNTDRETGTERHYFGGGYYCTGTPAERLSAALADLSKRAERASGYDTGGSIDMETLLGLPAKIPA